MAPAKKLFPRGGQLVSQGQKTKKMMQKVKKQQGKKADLFAEKRVFKESITPALREKFKGRKKAQVDEEMPQVVRENLGDVDLDTKNEEDNLPKFPLNVTPKMIKPGNLAMVAIRSVDEYGLTCNYPGGHTAYIRALNISDTIAKKCVDSPVAGRPSKKSTIDLSTMYNAGDIVTASVVYINKRHKIDLTMMPKVINSRLQGHFNVGDSVQGVISSMEDEGVIIDIGAGEESKGFMPQSSVKSTDRLELGKSVTFVVTEVLLDGRQVSLDLQRSQETISEVSRIQQLSPGQFVTFNSVRQHRNGLVGKCFEFGATLHALQADEDLLDTDDKNRIIPTRVVMIDYDEKRIILGNNDNIMSIEPLKPVKSRNGEVLEAQIELSEGYGLILFDANTQSRLYCPYHNITEEKSDKDTLKNYPVGKKVKARIISHCYLEGARLVTMRESTVEAEFFRYDEFEAGQIVTGKIQEVDAAGWVHVSLAPNLFGVLTNYHQAAGMLSLEAQKTRFKVGSDFKVMVLDTTKNKLFLTAKPALIKSKLKKIVSKESTEIGDISLGTVVSRSDKGVQVQLFNSIIVQVPVRHLSLEYIETSNITGLYELGQTIRVRIMEKPTGARKRWIGSFILDPKLRQDRIKSEFVEKVDVGAQFNFRVDELRDNQTILGTLVSQNGTHGRALMENIALGQSGSVRDTLLGLLKAEMVIPNVSVVNSTSKGVKVSNLTLAQKSIEFDQFCIYDEIDEIKPNEQYLVTVKKETDFGFMVAFGNGQRGLLPRAALVDAYLKDHKGVLKVGDLILVKVTQSDPVKKRFVVSSKESQISKPDWLDSKSIFDAHLAEIETALSLANQNITFGAPIKIEFGNKAACEREPIEPVKLVNQKLPDGFSAVCVGGQIQSSPDSIQNAFFVGFHAKNQLLFVLAPIAKVEEEKVFYSNTDFALTQKGDQIQLVLTKVIGIRSQLKVNRIYSTQTIEPISDNLNLARLSDASEQIEHKKWGIMDVNKLTPGQSVDGIVVGVKPFGIQIAIGHKLMGRCMFRNVTNAFMPKDKSLSICEKYLKKGMKVNVEVLECTSRTKLEFRLTKDYIDIDAEGLFCNKKRKTQITLETDDNAKKAKVEAEVKQEVTSLQEVAEMEMDLDDDLEAELVRRSSQKKVTKEVITEKNLTREEMEDQSRQAERESEQAKLPDSVDGWERALIASPNNSELWLRYAAHHITLGEIERARVVFDRALKTINFREGEEKLNVWKARINFEAMYGDEDSLIEQFNEAKRCNDEEKVYVSTIEQQMTSESYPVALRLLKEAVKKFPADHKLWSLMGKCQMLLGEADKCRVTMERALQANKSKDHISIVQKFARIEFEHGDVEKGKTIFEQTIKLYPKRGDVWSVYADLLMKFESADQAVTVLERGLGEIQKRQPRNHLIKRLVYMEDRRGDEEKAQEWRNQLV